MTRCVRCFRSQKTCLCAFIQPFATPVHFVILMHPKEARKERLGTGRLAHLGLVDSELIVGVDFQQHPRVNELIENPHYRPFLLYPGAGSVNLSHQDFSPQGLSTGEPEPSQKTRKTVVFLIDGTWPCARKMMLLSKNLHTLPRLGFTPPQESLFLIKHQPDPICLSTIEAIYYFLDAWEKSTRDDLQGRHHHLMEIFQTMVDIQIRCATDPTLPSYRKGTFKPPIARRRSLKWDKRKIFFEF